MATYSSILAWRIPWTEEPGRKLQRVDVTEQPSLATSGLQCCGLGRGGAEQGRGVSSWREEGLLPPRALRHSCV